MTESEYTNKLEGLKDRFSLRGIRSPAHGEVLQPRDNLFIENMRNPISSSSSDLPQALRVGVSDSFNTGLTSASRAVGEVGEIGTGLARGGTTATEAATGGEAAVAGTRSGIAAGEAAGAGARSGIAAGEAAGAGVRSGVAAGEAAGAGARGAATAATIIRDIALAIELMPK